jgi:hypothetical protein
MSFKVFGCHLHLYMTALMICVSAGNVSAQEETEFSFTAALAPHYSTGSANLDDRDHLIGGTGFLDLTVTNDNLTAFFQSQPQIPGQGEPVPHNHLARQAWVKVTGETFDIQAGRQLLIWGRADRFNPTDNLTPHDYRFLTIDDQGQRFGATGLVGRYFLSEDLTLTGVYLPFFTSSELPEGIIPAGVPRPQDKAPDISPVHDPQFAIKIDRSGAGFDGSLSYYHGYAPSPALTVGATGTLQYLNPGIDVLGGDFAFTRGDWGFRGEIAYTKLDKDRLLPDAAPQSTLYSVLGVEREVAENNLLLVQWLHRRLLDDAPTDSASPFTQPVAQVNAGIYGQYNRIANGMSVSLNSRWLNETLLTELAGAAWFNDGSFIFRPKATYAINDNWRVAGVLELYGGPDKSNFGVLKDNTRLFVELRYTY